MQVAGDDARSMVIASSIASQFEHLSGEVFHDCRQVHGRTSTNSFTIVSLLQEPVNTTNRELESSSR